MSGLLKVEGLVTRLRNGAAIVDGISFDIAAGETFALLGESGCGKSMTALSLMRLLPDGVQNTGGAVRMGQASLFELPEREMRSVRGGKMAMIFQEPGLSLNPVMTVGQQIAEVLELHGSHKNAVRAELVEACRDSGEVERAPFDRLRANGEGLSSGQVEQRCIELLDQVGIPDAARRMNEYPFQLSGGMKQRVMIAMALAGQPKLLIADEPTTALDVTIQAQVLQLLRDTQAQTGMAMLLITHDLGVVAENAHRVGVMYAGEIVETATCGGLFERPLHPYTQKLLAAMPEGRQRQAGLQAIRGNVPVLGSVTTGCRFAARCDQAQTVCFEETPAWIDTAEGGVRCHLYRDARPSAGMQGEEKAGRTGRYSIMNPSLAPRDESAQLVNVENMKVHFPIRKGWLQRTVGQVMAVDGVNLSIPQRRTLALVGESGCGKTTLGKALLGLNRLTAGEIVFEGMPLQEGKPIPGMQMVFQDPYASLNPKMRVAEILEEGMSALNIGGGSAERQARIDELLDKVGLARDSKWRYPHEFSGGQRQRIAIARALAVSPKLLICDEPTSALDVSVQAQILNLLKSLQDEFGLSYLFITHNLAVVEYLAHEVCVMYLGRIVERGPTEAVMRNPRHPYTQALLSAVPRIDGGGRQYIKLEGEMPSPSNPPQGCHFAPRCPQRMAACGSYPAEVMLSATHGVRCHLF